MNNFCKNCGSPLQADFNLCPHCGTPIGNRLIMNNQVPYQNPASNQNKYNGYYITTSIIMIVLAIVLFAGASANAKLGYDINVVFRVPALFALISGILCLCGRKNKILLIISGCLYFVGATFNIIGIKDISLFTIVAVIFGTLNIVFSLKK